MSSKGDAEKWAANARMEGERRGRKAPRDLEQSMARVSLIMECQRPVKDEYWRRVISDPQTYGDVLAEARALVDYHIAHLQKATERLNYLHSLLPQSE